MVKNLGIHHQATMWNPFSSGNSSATNTTGNSSNVQVPNVSQTPISPEGAQQLNNTMNQIDGQLVNNVPVEKARTIKEFIDESPHALYIIDGYVLLTCYISLFSFHLVHQLKPQWNEITNINHNIAKKANSKVSSAEEEKTGAKREY